MSALEKGDFIEFENMKGQLLHDSKYVDTQICGLNYADILWADKTVSKPFCLNTKGVRILNAR